MEGGSSSAPGSSTRTGHRGASRGLTVGALHRAQRRRLTFLKSAPNHQQRGHRGPRATRTCTTNQGILKVSLCVPPLRLHRGLPAWLRGRPPARPVVAGRGRRLNWLCPGFLEQRPGLITEEGAGGPGAPRVQETSLRSGGPSAAAAFLGGPGIGQNPRPLPFAPERRPASVTFPAIVTQVRWVCSLQLEESQCLHSPSLLCF